MRQAADADGCARVARSSELEGDHAREHRDDEHDAFDASARRAATSAGPGTEAGEAPADAEHERAGDEARDRCSRDVGRLNGAADAARACGAWRARRPTAPTASALAITTASDGSQRPARSRKPSTLAGSAMPETTGRCRTRARRRRRRARSCVSASRWRTTKTVAMPAAMKHSGGDDRARRQARDAADAVAAGAARAVARADADEEPRERERRQRRVERDGRKRAHERVDDRCGERGPRGRRGATRRRPRRGRSRPPTMPLTPATRPFRRAAAALRRGRSARRPPQPTPA